MVSDTLNYTGLKRRASEAERRGADLESPFVELNLGQPANPMECEVEILDLDGSMTTIRFKLRWSCRNILSRFSHRREAVVFMLSQGMCRFHTKRESPCRALRML